MCGQNVMYIYIHKKICLNIRLTIRLNSSKYMVDRYSLFYKLKYTFAINYASFRAVRSPAVDHTKEFLHLYDEVPFFSNVFCS